MNIVYPSISKPPALRQKRQSGTVLVVAMVILLVLTLLGVTALNTTTLEEKMAANHQETKRAFQAAESGLTTAFDDPDTFFDITAVNGVEGNTGVIGGTGANITARYIGRSPPPVGSLYSAEDFEAIHFETEAIAASRATDPGGGVPLTLDPDAARTELVGGAFQIGPAL